MSNNVYKQMIRLVCGFVFACVFRMICMSTHGLQPCVVLKPQGNLPNLCSSPVFRGVQSLQGFFNEVSWFSDVFSVFLWFFHRFPEISHHFSHGFPRCLAPDAWPPGARARSWPPPAAPPAPSADLRGESCDVNK